MSITKIDYFTPINKRLSLIVFFTILCLSVQAQQKDFEGVLYYNGETKSKLESITDKTIKTMIGAGDNLTVYVKEGKYKRSGGFTDEYYIPKDQKVYLKFKKIDTLYYLDYSFDTTKVISVSKTDEQKSIAGIACKAITITTSGATTKYFYAPQLHVNPEYDKNNTIGGFNVFERETESIWLSVYTETKNYTSSLTCSRIDQKALNETVFDLPKLPIEKFNLETLTKAPEFSRTGGWEKYLKTNLNTALGAKYVKIPKGENGARQTVQLSFTITETGEITNIKVLNKGDLHAKLADEAVRVIKESYGWKPGTIFGEKIDFTLKQGITFDVTKE